MARLLRLLGHERRAAAPPSPVLAGASGSPALLPPGSPAAARGPAGAAGRPAALGERGGRARPGDRSPGGDLVPGGEPRAGRGPPAAPLGGMGPVLLPSPLADRSAARGGLPRPGGGPRRLRRHP